MATVAQIKNLKPDYHKDIELRGSGLFCKSGFRDGDILEGHIELDDTLYEFDNMLHSTRPRSCTIFARISTIALAELYLLPLFDRPLTIYFADYCHNACRADDNEWWDPEDWDFPDTLPEVTISSDTVYGMLYSMRDVLRAWQADEPIVFPACLSQTARILSEELKVPITIDASLELPCSPKLLPASDDKQS